MAETPDRPLPAGWRWVRLGEVCRVVGGSTPASGIEKFWNGDIDWITPADLGILRGREIERSARRITREGFDSCGTEMVPRGSVVLSSRAPIGHVGIAAVSLCTNQGCKTLVPGPEVDSLFLYFSVKAAVPELQALGSGATFAEISKSKVDGFSILLPPLPDQRRIAALLADQMAAVDRTRAAAEARVEAARALPRAILRERFETDEAKGWPRRRLGDIAGLLPSKSIASDGDVEVRAITTACLTEAGFDPAGIKAARMRVDDVAVCVVSAGEVLVARSNTPDLVGRAAIFPGEPRGVVASDLTIRIRSKEGLDPAFLAAWMSYRFITGYWKERAGGASGSMKKITREQVLAEKVPCPHIEIQHRISASLTDRMATAEKVRRAAEAELAEIEAMPAALLRRAFRAT